MDMETLIYILIIMLICMNFFDAVKLIKLQISLDKLEEKMNALIIANQGDKK